MSNPRYEPLPCLNKWSEQLRDPFWYKKKVRSKARSDRALEHKKKKSRVEEGVYAGNIEDEEYTTSDVSITTDTDGPSVDPCTKVKWCGFLV